MSNEIRSPIMGKLAKDKITGFKGSITAHSIYISGCDQIFLQPPMKKGAFEDGKWFDLNRLEILKGKKIPLMNDNKEKVGAGEPAPIK